MVCASQPKPEGGTPLKGLYKALGGCWWATTHWAWPEWVYLPGIFLGLAAGAQNFWVFAKERMDRAKKDKNHRVGFNSHQ